MGKGSNSGRKLCQEWKVNARGYFRETEIFYEFPVGFPAALCDAKGYALFESEEDLRLCAAVTVYPRTTRSSSCLVVKGAVSNLSFYKRMR